MAKISDLDWSPRDEHELVTAGQECKLKVWNTRQKERCLTEASSNGIPFSRARYAVSCRVCWAENETKPSNEARLIAKPEQNASNAIEIGIS